MVFPLASQLLQVACPCGRVAWILGQPTILTVCPDDSCTLNTFPGIDGLVVGTVLPAYGSMVRFGDRVFTTAFDTNSAVGYSLHFNAQSILMQRGLNPDCTFALLFVDYFHFRF